ncbi:MAG: PepSY domain-containing protein [Anaerolineales bacterium]|nr:PepSY domain-containing protein [Anaerolineales bacterium]
MTSRPSTATAAPVQQTQPIDALASEDEDSLQEPAYTGSISVDETHTDGLSEADESAALQGQAVTSAAAAKAAAEAANPGAQSIKVELDNENGALVYSVTLDNGLDVKVDAGDATILHTEQAGDDADEVDNEVGDTDDVQEEYEAENEADDAAEGSEAPEDAPETPVVAPSP